MTVEGIRSSLLFRKRVPREINITRDDIMVASISLLERERIKCGSLESIIV